MSRSVDLFIDTQLPLGELARAIGILAQAPAAEAGDGYRLRRGEVTAELRAHNYLDDGTLRLSRYRYVLSARFAAGRPVNEVPEVAFVRNVADLVRQRMDAPALVVLDLEQRDPGAEALSAADDPAMEEVR